MNKEFVLKQTERYVKNNLEKESSGHDWLHICRVRNMALYIAEKEKNADLFVVQLAALLHDIADWKFHSGDDSVGSKIARNWLEKMNIDGKIISHVCEIVKEISFKGAGVKSKIKTEEGMIVQDADRLDALGALGISRCFASGGKMGYSIYDPNIKPKLHKTFEQYKSSSSTSINHFYEKLLLLKDLMNTKTGKKIAEERHKFMEHFLDKFFKEWKGKE